ncbi:MAG: tetratricopeptide repeat protein, partial [candidate division NC10 bacterium]|nr:tetratricopeptide repeat protein [candidate division NC10 bacterium]
AQTWNSLAILSEIAGKPEVAEMWYRKAIEGFKAVGDKESPAKCLNNLADLLRDLPGRLAEARQLAEEALVIDKTLDPGAAEIWKTYNILAQIAEKEAETTSDGPLKAGLETQAREYRRLARDAKFSFAGTRHELRKHAPLILATILATQQQNQRDKLEQLLPQLEQRGWTNLVAAIRGLLADERNSEVLCEGLDLEDSMIIETILHALDDPSTLKDLLPDEKQE